MSTILAEFNNEYEDLIFLETNNKNDIYIAYNIAENKNVSLKIINKKKFKDIKLLKEKLNKEKEIIDKCASKFDNILKIYRILETENNFILEQDYYETNMHQYIEDNGPLDINKDFFEKIAKNMNEFLKILFNKEIIHRKIKSSSIFLKENYGKYEIKFGNFDQAIYYNENKSEPLDSFYYTAPEIINGDKYDKRSDLWSFGITLYDIYFGDLPYGYKPSKMKIIKALSNQENFHYEKTNFPLLDKLFDGLLRINPDERISYEDLFNIIDNKDFINKNVIIKKTILSSSLGGSNISKNQKYNNILYYNENQYEQYRNIVLKDCKTFENETPGGFIFCSNKELFQIIKEEIKSENRKNNKIKFNLITTGRTFKKINKIIENDKEFANCLENKCIFCIILEKYQHYKDKNPNINIYNKNYEIKDFIKRTCSNKIIPFKINKLITNIKINPNYKSIYNLYGELDDERFKKYFEMFEKFINKKEQKELMMDKFNLLNIFKNITNKNFLNIFINYIYHDFNNFIIEDINIEESIAYFTARIMYYFPTNKNIKYYNWGENEIYMGTNLKLSELLQYKRRKGKIAFPYFTIFYEELDKAIKLAHREKSKQYYKDNKKFSVIFILNKKDFTVSGFDITEFCINKEKAILFLPFDLFELKKIIFDFSNFTADIYI